MKKEIYLAGGCFWGLEKYLSLVDGVLSTQVGYANGGCDNPSYDMVCRGSGHAEVVFVKYDSSVLQLQELLDVFLLAIDPTTKNKQGNDTGVQYRTGIYYTDNSVVGDIKAWIAKIQPRYKNPILIEVEQLQNYTKAEEYHQGYLGKKPNGYCHIGDDKFACAAEYVPSSKK